MSAAVKIDRSRCPVIPDLSELSASELAAVASKPLRCANCGDVLELTCVTESALALDPKNAIVLIPRCEYDELLEQVAQRVERAGGGVIRDLDPSSNADTSDGFTWTTRPPVAVPSVDDTEPAAGDRIQLERHEDDREQYRQKDGHHAECRLRHGGSRCSCRRHGWQPPS